MKKVFIDIQPLLKNKTGIGWYAYNIIKRVLKEDHNLIEYCGFGFDFLNKNNSKSITDEINFDKIDIYSKIPVRIYKALWNILPEKYSNLFPNGDLYHYLNYIVPPIDEAKKVIINVYDMVYKRFPETMKTSNLYMLERDMEKSIYRADKIITISENTKNEILEYFDIDEDKISIIAPGIDISCFAKTKENGLDEKKRIKNKYKLPDNYFLYFGTIEPRKNIATILRAYAELQEDIRHEFKLVFSGGMGWKNKELMSMINQSGLSDQIVFTGYVEEADKAYIYNMAKIFLFPSLYEGYGMPISEAMASGTPVITSNVSSMPEAGGKAASYISPLDYLAMSKEIEKLLSDENYYNEKVNLGVKQAEKFSWDNAAKQTVEVYHELLGI